MDGMNVLELKRPSSSMHLVSKKSCLHSDSVSFLMREFSIPKSSRLTFLCFTTHIHILIGEAFTFL